MLANREESIYAYCPERVLPGRILHELIDNDRIVGGMTSKAGDMAVDFYKLFVEGVCIRTDARTAEMCKLAENTSRDINIAYANELSIICDQLDIDVWQLITLANHHPRVNILKPGPGVGGHCIAVDPWFIVDKTPEQVKLIRTAREVNDGKVLWAIDKIEQAITREIERGKPLQNVKIACLGLSYKANIDDLRESPALSIVQFLANKYPGQISVVEPNICVLPEGLRNSGVVLLPMREGVEWAAIVVILVDHKQFEKICFEQDDQGQFIDLVGIRKVK